MALRLAYGSGRHSRPKTPSALRTFLTCWRGWGAPLALLWMDGRRPRLRYRLALEVDALPQDDMDLEALRSHFAGWRVEVYGPTRVVLTPPAMPGLERGAGQ